MRKVFLFHVIFSISKNIVFRVQLLKREKRLFYVILSYLVVLLLSAMLITYNRIASSHKPSDVNT